jgi:K+-transporting ATPase KdpF subunit
MTLEQWIGAVVSLGLCAYLLVALVRAERF